MTFRSQHVSVSIDRPPAAVYAFASNPANLPRWATGLSGSIAYAEGVWVSESPMGRVTVRLVETNPHGVLDHVVTLPSGEEVYNPMRVFPNGDGSEVVFSVYQRRDVSDRAFADDAAAVARDLQTLKAVLES